MHPDPVLEDKEREWKEAPLPETRTEGGTKSHEDEGAVEGGEDDILTEICKGRLSLTRKNWEDFLDAICTHPEPLSCVDLLTNSNTTEHGGTGTTGSKPPGLVALNRAMNMDYSYFFYEGLFTRLVTFFRLSEIQPSRIRDTVVEALRDPPIFWVSLLSTIWRMNLPEETVECVAWLIWQYYSCISPSPSGSPTPNSAVKLYKGDQVLNLLLESSRKETREIAEKLQALLPQPLVSPKSKAMGYGDPELDVEDFNRPPGGRHDNDYENFRKIDVYPTPSEIKSKRLPYLPKIAAFGGDPSLKGGEDGGKDGGVGVPAMEQQYLEALFRLYREDAIENIRRLTCTLVESRDLESTTPQLELIDVVAESGKGSRHRWALAFKACEELVWYASPHPSTLPSPITPTPNPVTGVDTPVDESSTLYRLSIAKAVWWPDGCLVSMVDGEEVVGVCTYVRDVARLAQSPSVIVVNLQGTEDVVQSVMRRIKASQARAKGKVKQNDGVGGGGGIRLVFPELVKSDSFKVLEKLQTMKKVPFREEILGPASPSSWVKEPENVPREFLKGLEANPTIDIGQFFGLRCAITLNAQQSEALSSALRERLCLIQGFSSTGKSFLASLITKVLHEHTSQSIMIITHDDKALSKVYQQLTTRVCIPTTKMVFLTQTQTIPFAMTLKGMVPASADQIIVSEPIRSGSPTPIATTTINTPGTQPMQAGLGDPSLQHGEDTCAELGKAVKVAFDEYYVKPSPSKSNEPIMRYLATQESEMEYYNALRVPEEESSEDTNLQQSSKLDKTYLLERWRNGEDAGVLSGKPSTSSDSAARIWGMSSEERREKVDTWEKATASADLSSYANANTEHDGDGDSDAITRLYNVGQQFNVYQEVRRLQDMDLELSVLKEKRIIGGTIRNISEILDLLGDVDMPEVVIVMGGDALPECEVVTMLGSKAKHLVMMGGIPTRRPTFSLPRLTEAFKKGHNLDVSLFERLIQKSYPCHVLHTIYPSNTQIGINSFSNMGWGGVTQTYHTPPPLAPLPLPPPPRRRNTGWSAASSAWSRPASPSRPQECSTTPNSGDGPGKTALQRKIGATEKEWIHRKTELGVSNVHVDAIMGMIGIEEVKTKVLDIMDTVELIKKQKRSLKDVTFNAVLFGNPGTGMPIFAKHYFKFLESIGAIRGTQFLEINVVEAENFMQYVRTIARRGGGIHVIDAHKPGRYSWSTWLTGGLVDSVTPDTLVEQMTKGAGKQAYLFSGLRAKMETWLASNPVLDDALPYGFHFPDYEEEELLQLFELRLVQLFQGEMKVEGGVDGPYARLAIRKLAAKRNCEGFGNEVDVHYLIDDILMRQAKRMRAKEGGEGDETGEVGEPDCMLITKEDLLVQHSKPIEESEAYKELQSLIGLASTKATIDSLVTLVQVNNERQLKGKKSVEVLLNRVFLGPPGTGKTTVAKLYAKLLNEMGLLSTGEVVTKNANDFIGQFIGQSEANTKAILASAKGKVLIIDEAHILNPTSYNNADVFKEDVIDSLVSGIQNMPGDDQCVLLLGYEEEMFDMFENANPGLNRRFRISDSFYFPDFTTDELLQIFDAKLRKEGLSATPAARKVVAEMLDRARYRPNFGNGGAVDNIIANAKENYFGRFKVTDFPDDILFEPQDFDPDYDRGGEGSERLAALFEEMVGCEDIMAKFEEYQIVSRTMRRCGKDAKKVIPMNFVFKGPPGTGKTTIARKMGQIFYDMGFLASAEVIECSATDMIGSYLGQTGPKTQKLFKKALGKVLFVDEAYRLCYGEYAQEAVGELVTLLTQKTYHMKMVVVLSGYDKDMDILLLRNRGLASRFPEQIVFNNIDPAACLEILRQLLQKTGVRLRCLEEKGRDYRKMAEIIKRMSGSSAWGNARDMVSLSVHLIREAHKVQTSTGIQDEVFELSSKAAVRYLVEMREEQQQRASAHPQHKSPGHGEGEKFNPSAVLEQLNVARWRAVKQQLNGVNSSYSRTQFYDIPGP
ncbi:hypothetical protein E1B28_001983 [Marasmius oreades]|uniref:AAA+ ATPase domain-containing protein n=1 Tax=Marasmius oreades TaxID=181124 RepID=A0A9P7V4L4_9AGAR|nr:uncharacterized protein E1B28_001983 [Marasmius oreades]KAG7100208.1 hypothetical protein E1B28_001983 [Marasmius oreades]